jgi:hypothetical protein
MFSQLIDRSFIFHDWPKLSDVSRGSRRTFEDAERPRGRIIGSSIKRLSSLLFGVFGEDRSSSMPEILRKRGKSFKGRSISDSVAKIRRGARATLLFFRSLLLFLEHIQTLLPTIESVF